MNDPIGRNIVTKLAKNQQQKSASSNFNLKIIIYEHFVLKMIVIYWQFNVILCMLPIHVASDLLIWIILSVWLSCGNRIAEYDIFMPAWITIRYAAHDAII